VNLALPALVLLLGLLPGVACFYGYFAGRFEKQAVGVTGLGELALYILFAIPLNIAALFICRLLGIPLNFVIATQLAAGNLTEPEVVQVAAAIEKSAVLTGFVYLIIVVASGLVGSLFRRFVWSCRLDTRIPHLRLKHGWFYALQGRLHGFPRTVVAYVDVLTRLPDQEGQQQTRLYRGVVVDFEIASSGAIDSLTLTRAKRGKGRSDKFMWKDIPSSRLVLMGSAIHSINVTYIDMAPHAHHETRRRKLGTWLSDFWREAP